MATCFVFDFVIFMIMVTNFHFGPQGILT
jgi:hypothetical protein